MNNDKNSYTKQELEDSIDNAVDFTSIEIMRATVKLCISTIEFNYDGLNKKELIELIKKLPDRAEAIIGIRRNN